VVWLFMSIEIYDLITNTRIIGKNIEIVKQFGWPAASSDFFHLKSGKIKHVRGRFILPENINKITFTLVDFDTLKEYRCVTNKTIFLHLGVPYDPCVAGYVFELRRKRQKLVSISDRVLYLKGSEPTRISQLLSAKSERADQIRTKQKFCKIIVSRLRHRIVSAIRTKHSKKSGPTKCLIGCDYPFLMKYLESKFTFGMTWENYGQWHVDHIKPCFEFDLTIPEEQMKCFHYTNLRPRWATSKIASQYGEINYLGNMNRSRSQYDTILV